MTLSSDAALGGQDSAWLLRRLADIERDLTELRAAKSAQATTIGTGGITVTGSGAVEVYSADGTRKVSILDSAVRLYPDLVNTPSRYFYIYSAPGAIHQSEWGYYDTVSGNEYGGNITVKGNALDLMTRPGDDADGELQGLYLEAVGGLIGEGTVGNLLSTNAMWLTGKQTGLSAGTTVINYGRTYDSVPRPLVTLKAPAAVAWAVTAYTTSNFTINVAAGPAAGTVEVMYWAIRPTIP